jgi:hypothetical protein
MAVHPLGRVAGGNEDLGGPVVEEAMIVTRMRTQHLPAKRLDLDVEREHVREKRCDAGGYVGSSVG